MRLSAMSFLLKKADAGRISELWDSEELEAGRGPREIRRFTGRV